MFSDSYSESRTRHAGRDGPGERSTDEVNDTGIGTPTSNASCSRAKAAALSDSSSCRSTVRTALAVRGLAARETLVPFAGFLSFMAFSQLYENSLLASNIVVFNYALFGSIAQLLCLAAIGAVTAARPWEPSVGIVVASALLANAGVAAQLFTAQSAVNLAGSLACGSATALLAVAWGARISKLSRHDIFLFVLGALLGGTALCFACFATHKELSGACALVLPLASCAFYAQDRRRHALSGKAPSETPTIKSTAAKSSPRMTVSLPWPFLIMLAACCLLSSFFVGVTMNPYVFQSDLVSRYMHLFTLLAFSGLLVCALVVKCPRIQLFFIAALALLLIGLFLLSAGVLGSIIMPLGLVLAAKNCCFALCWIAFAMLSKTSRMAPCALFGFGLALCNGTLGRGAGMIASNGAALSFPDIALAASLCIVAFALFYAFTIASHPRTDQTIAHDFPKASTAKEQGRAKGSARVEPAESVEGAEKTVRPRTADKSPAPGQTTQQMPAPQAQKLERYGLTAQELRIAEFVLQGKTYREIAALLDISERTVKFHAKNAYRKAGVENKIDFVSKTLSGN